MQELKQQTILERVAAPVHSDMPLPRALLVFAHPDDEVIAVGGRLERFRASRFVCVTDGALRDLEVARARGFATPEMYAAGRRGELEAALRLGGIGADQAVALRVAGQDEAIVDQQAALHLPAIARALAREIAEFAPEAVVTHPYEGGHPDHDSCAFAVHAALRLLSRAPAPLVVEAPFYHAGANGMETGRFLPNAAALPAVVHELSPEESARKQARFACFRSQADILRNFGTVRELYRAAPEYDFTQPPHAGELLYEGWNWPIDGARFRALATAALRELGLARV